MIVKKKKKNDIKKILGQPSTESKFDNDLWIYIEREITRGRLLNFGKNILIKNNVLILEIDSRGILLSKKFNNIKDLNITSGIMGSYAESNSELFAGNKEGSPINFASNFALYTQVAKKLYDRLTLSAGGRWENYQINETDKESKPVFRAGISGRVLKATYVRASYGEGFRFPTIGEKYIRTVV